MSVDASWCQCLTDSLCFLKMVLFNFFPLGPFGETGKVILHHVHSSVPAQMCTVKIVGKRGAWAPEEFLGNFKQLKIQDLLRGLLREGDNFVFVSEMSRPLGTCVI